MTDLASLFRTPTRLTTLSQSQTAPNPSRLTRAPERPLLSAFSVQTHPAPTTQPWSLNQIEQSLKRGVKLELREEEIRQEMNLFTRRERQQLLNKGVIVGGITLLIYSLTNWHIFFVSTLLFASQLISSQALPITQQPSIMSCISIFRRLLKAILLYCLLKHYFLQPYDSIHWPLTLLAIIASAALQTLHIYSPLTTLTSDKHIVKIVGSRSLPKKVSSLPAYIFRKMAGVSNALNHIAIISCLSFVLLISLVGFNTTVQSTLRPDYLLATLVAAFLVEIYIQIVAYVDQVLFDPLRIIYDKMPVFLTLLRLSPSPYHRHIKRQCMKSLFIRVVQIECFLSSETCKSLLYRSYMDIFNQHALNELQTLNSSFLSLLQTIRSNKVIIQSKKTLIDDLFIHLRKAKAHFENEWHCLDIVGQFNQLSFLLAVIAIADREAHEQRDGVRVSPRVHQIIASIRQKFLQCAEMKFLSRTMRKSILEGHLWLQKEISEASDRK